MDDNDERYHNSENSLPAKQPETDDMTATDSSGDESEAEDIQSKRDEEFASEMTADDSGERIASDEDDGQVNSAWGWFGVALSVISFFVMPIILGGAGVVLGFVSRSRGADILGNTAIIAGAISVLITMFVLPFV